jgi:phage gp46-like protein
MQDLGIIYQNGLFDLDLGDGGDTVDVGLRTAVIISLFSDRRAEADDVLPDGGTDRRGWWGDLEPAVENDLIGSRLWLLSREKQLSSVLLRAETYARQALAWLVEDGVCRAVTVTGYNPADGVLALKIELQDATGDVTIYTARLTSVQGAAVMGSLVLDSGGDSLLDETGGTILG